MLFYLIAFVVAVFLIRIPIFLFGIMFRFGKPISLIGFGALLGVTLTAGTPDISVLLKDNAFEEVQPRQSHTQDEGTVRLPEMLEAANDIAIELQDAVVSMVMEMEQSWRDSATEKLSLARKQSASEYAGLTNGMKRAR